jgi:DNA polymerase-3 subunit alpha
MFVHLRTHSSYSFLEGLPMPAELAYAASQQGMLALALTDHRWLTGAIEFYDDCLAVGVRPILGLELEITPPQDFFTAARQVDHSRLVFLAGSIEGWSSLCRLSSLANVKAASTGEGSLPIEQLAANSAGLICLTGGRRGLAAKLALSRDEATHNSWLQLLKGLFPDRLYAELQIHSEQDIAWVEKLSSIASRLGLPAVATHDIHYMKPEDDGLQRVATAIRLNSQLENLPPDATAPPAAYFTPVNEMEARFSRYPEALQNTLEVAERCSIDLPLGVPRYPELDLPEGTSSIQLLRNKADAGLHKQYEDVTPELKARLNHELEVIEASGYASLFLIMEDILRFARESGVPFSSRGSAASSLVAHCLGITSPDPIKLNLYFERFLNPARATPPDIDTDLCSRRRDQVIHYVYQRYGEERVAMVCTINRFRRRSALREVAKAFGASQSEIKKLADNLPSRWYGPPLAEPNSDDPYAELSSQYSTPRHSEIFQYAACLIGRPHHLSIHPGGVVIAPGVMTDLVPTQLASKGVIITQFDLESIERLGLVKIDLLGIRGLTVLGDVGQGLQSRKANHPSTPLNILEGIPEKDEETSDLIQAGRTIGCFQIESPGMRTTLKEIQAHSLDDIMVALALYRPGPLSGGLKGAFVRRHLGAEPAEHLHPALAPLLEDTYGVILYQEQVLRIAHELAGLSLADADLLRRAMSHFDPGKEMQRLKDKFIRGALAVSAIPEETASQIWELMAAFAGYGFPKAHAASYAQVAWRSAWCKAHQPDIFMAAVLANWGGYYSQRVYLMEARRLGLKIQPPHVNHARSEFSVTYLDERPNLFMGLNQVRELTRRTQTQILRQRPFHSFQDFLARADPRLVEAENLVSCGALEGLGTIPDLLERLRGGGWRGGQLSFFQSESTHSDWTVEQKAAAQERVLGASVIAHPLELHAEKINTFNALNTLEAAQRAGQRVRVAGMRQTWRRSRTSKGGYIYFMTLEDLEGMLSVILFDDVHQRYRAELKKPGPYIVEGLLEIDPNTPEPVMQAERVWALS